MHVDEWVEKGEGDINKMVEKRREWSIGDWSIRDEG
jgi:hypothetical protein